MKRAHALPLIAALLCLALGLTSCDEKPTSPGAAPAASASDSSASPGTVMGTATFEDGRPIPDFKVQCGGVIAFGAAQGVNGHYTLQVPPDALVASLGANAFLTYEGKPFAVSLCPTDGLPDSGDVSGYRADASKGGIVRNFTLKMTGLMPGHDPNAYPDYTTSGEGQIGTHYGGELDLICWQSRDSATDSIGKKYQGATVTLTFTPTGPLLDGSVGSVLTRSVPLTGAMELYGLPIGPYTVTATMADSGGQAHSLVISTFPLQNVWSASAPLDWSQSFLGRTDAVTLYLSE